MGETYQNGSVQEQKSPAFRNSCIPYLVLFLIFVTLSLSIYLFVSHSLEQRVPNFDTVVFYFGSFLMLNENVVCYSQKCIVYFGICHINSFGWPFSSFSSTSHLATHFTHTHLVVHSFSLYVSSFWYTFSILRNKLPHLATKMNFDRKRVKCKSKQGALVCLSLGFSIFHVLLVQFLFCSFGVFHHGLW